MKVGFWPYLWNTWTHSELNDNVKTNEVKLVEGSTSKVKVTEVLYSLSIRQHP